MQARVCAYTAQAQTRDLRYISIWQSINTVIEYRIMMRCFMSIENGYMHVSKDCSP